MPILKPGETCWRIEQAERAAFLVDGDAYFRALWEALRLARRSVFILSWDIHTRVHLLRNGDTASWPPTLGDFLHALLERNRRLDIYILNWDWAMLYALERQWLPLFRLDWRRHHRLHFQLDDHYPFGASQHQKVIVVDDRLALCGGLDPTDNRWDTPEHRADDPRRVDTDGEPYHPFHDVQMLVSGEAAAALGDLARDRWYRATGERIARRSSAERASWPSGVTPDATDLPVAIARTAPPYDGAEPVEEVKRLYLTSIAAAERWIYAESQYFTSWEIGEAFAARLREPEGPEIVLILPVKTGAWIEQHTMDVLRSRVISRLRESDLHGRLRLYYPTHDALGEDFIFLHSKLMVVDDRLLQAGSANLSNRSMGLDTECNLAVEADAARLATVVAGLRNRLLAEHLGTTPETVADHLAAEGSLIGAIERLCGGPRTLRPLEVSVSELADQLLPGQGIVDPERPVSAEELAERMLPPEERRSTARQLAAPLAILAVIGLLAALWQWTPLHELVDVGELAAQARDLSEQPVAPALVIASFLLGGLLVLPVTLLVVLAVLALGPWAGFAYALIGAELSALMTYGLGQLLGRRRVRRLAGRGVNRLSRNFARRGVVAVVAVRLVPIAPFTIVNLIAGASRVGWRRFALGTVLGLVPGMLAVSLFADRVAATLDRPDLPAFALLAGAFGLIVTAFWGIRLWLRRQVGLDGRRRKGAAGRRAGMGRGESRKDTAAMADDSPPERRQRPSSP